MFVGGVLPFDGCGLILLFLKMLEHNGLPWKFEPNFLRSSLPSIHAPSFTLSVGRALCEWPLFCSVLGTRPFCG